METVDFAQLLVIDLPQNCCLASPNWRPFWLLDCEKMQQLWRELSLPFARSETLLVSGIPKTEKMQA